MKEKTQALLFTAARVLTAGLWFWAAVYPSYNSRWYFQIPICAVAVWGFFRALGEDEFSTLFFYLLVGLLFFPLSTFLFARTTWKIVDITIGVLMLLSIFIVDAAPFQALMKKPAAGIFRRVIHLLFAAGWVVFGGALIYYSGARIVNIIKLKMDGKQTAARITRVTHAIYSTTDADHNTESYDIYKTEFIFETEDGQTVNGLSELYDNPVSHLIPDGLLAEHPRGFAVSENMNAPLTIEYEKNHPKNNRALGHREGWFSTIFGSICLALLSLIPLAGGFLFGEEQVRRLLPAKKPQSSTREKRAVKKAKSK
ncbi:MAG: DUF3592 domain-containing protein [Acidobacteriota bacterium]